MVENQNLAKYYRLYIKIREIPRFTIKQISPALNIGGRGQKYDTVRRYVTKLYSQKISLRPNLFLRTFENCYTKAYFLKLRKSISLSTAYYLLKKNKNLSYMLLLSGDYDFFVTSKFDLKFKNLIVKKKSISYTPYYTLPQKWNCEVRDCLLKMADSSLSEGKIERKFEDWLPWEDIHFQIYEIMKNNVQIPFLRVSKLTGYAQTTINRYFYKDILPYCNISHYFFPKGYDHYVKSFILARSKYEKGLLETFSKLPCTSYFFPLEEEIAINLFHENTNDLMFAIRKLEEKGYIEKYLLLVPLHWE